ncbi:MAG: helix-hairpin-helix domain-containing protein [Chitinophagales bacterium]
MWKKFLRNYFTFNKKERNGLIVLLLIMLLITFWPAVFKRLYKDPPVDFSAFQLAIDSFRANSIDKADQFSNGDSSMTSLAMGDYAVKTSATNIIESELQLFPFDPNSLAENGWKSLGVPEKNIRTILKYRSKGGKFFKKEDLKMIYGFRESDFNRLEPYIQFAGQSQVIKPASESMEKEVVVMKRALLEVNAADSAQLDLLRGVGPVLSSRIIKYRNKLGGFVSLEQLQEIYGLSPESFDIIKDQLTIDESAVHKLSINSISINDLKMHPYFRYPIATMIINYRDQHGHFQQPEDLKNVEVITDSIYKKIIPYLLF